MSEVYLIIGMMLVTFSVRYVLFPLSRQATFPPALERGLRYVPPTVLTAIIIPAVLIPDGVNIDLSYTNPYLIGAIIAALVGWFSRNLLLTIVIGMAGFFGWQAIITLLG